MCPAVVIYVQIRVLVFAIFLSDSNFIRSSLDIVFAHKRCIIIRSLFFQELCSIKIKSWRKGLYYSTTLYWADLYFVLDLERFTTQFSRDKEIKNRDLIYLLSSHEEKSYLQIRLTLCEAKNRRCVHTNTRKWKLKSFQTRLGRSRQVSNLKHSSN